MTDKINVSSDAGKVKTVIITEAEELSLGSAVSPVSRVRETRAKVLLCIYMKLVKGTRGTNVECLPAVGQRRWNLVTRRRERQSAKQLVTQGMCTARNMMLCEVQT